MPDVDVARREAVGFARDLMRIQRDPRDWSRWVIQVTEELQQVVLNLAFTEVAQGHAP